MAQDNQVRNDYGLFNVSYEHLSPGEPTEAFLEQYKLYLAQIDKLGDRRQSSNSFFLTLNTGLCAAFAFLCAEGTSPMLKPLHLVIPIAGILISFFWHRLVSSYRQLSSGKFLIVHQMEAYLPMAPFAAEWRVLGSGNDKSKYLPLTHVEVWVPRLFIIMYVVLMIYLVPWIDIYNWIYLRY
jgi:hypothetical protein